MKRIFLFIVCVLGLSVITFAQINPAGLNNIQIEQSSSISKSQVETKKYLLNITIENSSIIEGLILKPNNAYQKMYLNGNWGSIDKRIKFEKDIKSQTVSFVCAYRVIQVGDVFKLYQEGVPCDKMKNFVEADIFKDIFTKKILVKAEFQNSFGELVKKDLEINFENNSPADGDEVFAVAKITNEDLGLNVVTLKANTEKLFFKFSLKNEEYGINMIVDPNKSADSISVLAGKIMPDGIYPFVCRIGLPNGIQKEETVEAFVSDGEISLDNSSFNPLVFANGDYGKATFKGKVSLVKFVNTRSTALTIFLPADYVVTGKSFTSNESEIATEAFTKDGGGWKSYVIAPGGYVKIKMKVSVFPIVLYDLNRKNTNIIQIGLVSKNFQVINLKWGDGFSLLSEILGSSLNLPINFSYLREKKVIYG